MPVPPICFVTSALPVHRYVTLGKRHPSWSLAWSLQALGQPPSTPGWPLWEVITQSFCRCPIAAGQPPSTPGWPYVDRLMVLSRSGQLRSIAVASTACANPAYAGGDQGQKCFEPTNPSGGLIKQVIPQHVMATNQWPGGVWFRLIYDPEVCATLTRKKNAYLRWFYWLCDCELAVLTL